MAIINQTPQFAPQKQQAIREFPINDSSFLMHVRYDPSTLMATVTLKSGGQYNYMMVAPGIIDQWMQAPSKGKFFATAIRGKFSSARLVNKTVGPRGGTSGKPTSHRRTGHAR